MINKIDLSSSVVYKFDNDKKYHATPASNYYKIKTGIESDNKERVHFRNNKRLEYFKVIGNK